MLWKANIHFADSALSLLFISEMYVNDDNV